MKVDEGGLVSVEEKDLELLKNNPDKFWYGIHRIEDLAFDTMNIEEIVIPESVKSIGDSAFQHCQKLRKLILPKKLVRLRQGAFFDCSSLTEIYLPAVVDMEGGTFSSCDNLKVVHFEEGLEELPSYTFHKCYSLGIALLPTSLKKINEGAFAFCTSLQKVVLPQGLKEIDNYAFEGCVELKEITIPSSVETLGYNIFKDCPNLEEVTIQNKNNIKQGFEDLVKIFGLSSFRTNGDELTLVRKAQKIDFDKSLWI